MLTSLSRLQRPACMTDDLRSVSPTRSNQPGVESPKSHHVFAAVVKKRGRGQKCSMEEWKRSPHQRAPSEEEKNTMDKMTAGSEGIEVAGGR